MANALSFPVPRLAGTRARRLAAYGLPLLWFGLLTAAITWPAVRTFTTHYIGQAGDDPRHNIWFIWHVKEAVLGRQPLYDVGLLYYPQGISLLTHGYGPLMGLLALPFWPWGPAAAYNGAVLLGFGLTGYAMYLLARGLGFSRWVSLFAGTLLLAAPMHVFGLTGHMGKIFVALLPLALLAIHHALDLERSGRWALAPAIIFLLALLHNGLQFVLAALAAGFFVVVALVQARPADRPLLLRRVLVIGASSLILAGPLLLATMRAAERIGLKVNTNLESFSNLPDLVEFILPAPWTRLFGAAAWPFFNDHRLLGSVETAVFLSWVGLLLCAAAAWSRRRQALIWLLFTAIWVVLAMGPSLQILGRRTFSEYGLPIAMPYVLLTALPGMDFLRTPGRLMLMGFVGFGIAAAYGLAWLSGRFPRAAAPLAVAAMALVLLETWPQMLPRTALPATAPFYQQLAADGEMYGVFDLPVLPPESRWYVEYSSRYQMDQMVHGKGITGGYISRTYGTHPVFPCLIPELRPPGPDLLLNGEPATCYENALDDLARNGYRYVVWHKPGAADAYSADPQEVDAVSAYLLGQFEGQEPVMDDAWTTVYAVPEAAATVELAPAAGFAANWYSFEDGGRRWAQSPATLWVWNPAAQDAVLAIRPDFVGEPGQPGSGEGVLILELDGERVGSLAIRSGEVAAAPLRLPAGFHSLALSLEGGNFRPSDRGGTDSRWLSFAIQSIDLQLGAEAAMASLAKD